MIGKPQRIARKSALKPRIKPIGRRTVAKGKKTKPKLPSISKMIKKNDELWSMCVRGITKENREEPIKCYTCPRVLPRKLLQGGHWIGRGYKATRWHLDNGRPQCAGCNNKNWGNGRPHIFRKNLVAEIGLERVQYLEEHFEDNVTLTRPFLQEHFERLKSILQNRTSSTN